MDEVGFHGHLPSVYERFSAFYPLAAGNFGADASTTGNPYALRASENLWGLVLVAPHALFGAKVLNKSGRHLMVMSDWRCQVKEAAEKRAKPVILIARKPILPAVGEDTARARR